MEVRTLHVRPVFKKLEEEDKTKGGINIPGTAKEKPIEVEVMAAITE